MDLKECIEKGYLISVANAGDLVEKERKESDYDFSRAQKAFEENDFKWTIIKGYYSMFHAVKALCFKLGYQEKKHLALLILLEQLSKEGKLESKYVNYFNMAIGSREEADYHYHHSQEIAVHNLRLAESFNAKMKELLNKI